MTFEFTGNLYDFTIYTNLVYFKINAIQWYNFKILQLCIEALEDKM